jgi:hypothetical protein
VGRSEDSPDLYRLDLSTGKRTLILKNDRMVAIIPDHTLRARVGIGISPDGTVDLYRPTPGGGWAMLWDIGPEDVAALNATAYLEAWRVDQENKHLLMFDTEGRDLANIGSTNMGGRSNVHIAPGVRYSGWPFDRTYLDPYYAHAHALCKLGPFTYDPAHWADERLVPDLPPRLGDMETTLFQRGRSDFNGYYDKLVRAPKVILLLHASAVNPVDNAIAAGMLREMVYHDFPVVLGRGGYDPSSSSSRRCFSLVAAYSPVAMLKTIT